MTRPNPYSAPYGPPPHGPAKQTNALAVASLVLGILWLCWLGSILAIILGHVGLSQIKKTGAGGRGIAVAGLVLGYIGLGTFLSFGVLSLAVEDRDNSAQKPAATVSAPSASTPAGSSSPAGETKSRKVADITVETCEVNELFGYPRATGVVENKTGETASFEVKMQFSRKDGTILGTGDTTVEDVPSQGKKKYEVADLGVSDEKGPIKCASRVDLI